MSALPAHFWAKTRTTDCIVWTGAANSKGYPCFLMDGSSQLAHRLAYEDKYGPIPDGMTVDHLCRVRTCVNADHLEVVTIAENNRRKKTADGLRVGGECIYGHQLTDLTVYRHPRGHLECRECRREQKRRQKAAS